MRKTILICLMALLALTFASCELESSDNGKLDGYWHLEAIDSISGGVADLSKQTRFWSFQGKLLQFSDSANDEMVFMRFNYSGDSLILTEPRILDRTLGDTLITNIGQLCPYGINSLEEHFYVDHLSGSKMILSSNKLRLNFRKF
jgi:hypothetical protein